MDLTVAVCTYRRPELLGRALESIAAADPPDAAWELVVVDNEGNPRAAEVAGGFEGRLPIRYCHEPKIGNSQARNRASQEARGTVILFTDDDALVDQRWLVEMVGAIRSHPECEFWGGKVKPLWDVVSQPDWFDEVLCPILRDVVVQYDAGDSERSWRPGEDSPFITCNLALRAEAVRRVGMFDTNLGYVGEKRLGGEDSQMVRAISAAGGPGWYAANAVVYHPVPADRISREYALDFARRQGQVSVELAKLQSGGKVPRWLYRAALTQWLAARSRQVKGAGRGGEAARFARKMDAAFAGAKLRHLAASMLGRGPRALTREPG